ncbi:mannan endo-1,6-alpha-mannosidase-like protein [Aureobasidium pullulans]|nr:mannan endo-1,6-alpha-mannosidase-like protein [Aureobasidium pullulans]THY82580.1 mannan endo-1,6-alpha-mannosidase-like protein [Aureobasidium pullulans]
MRLTQSVAAVAACAQLGYALDLDVTSSDSIRTAASTLAHGLMNYYQNNKTDTPKESIGTLPWPLYWWEAGAVWGGLIDYWAYTNDTSFNDVVMQAIMAQTGTDNNFLPEAYYSSMGNDDQAFWTFSALSALEYGFPDPPEGSPSWQTLAVNAFDSMAPRWDTATCGGGLRWQVFSTNNGWTYKNSVSNGGFFQMAARLARFTGNSTYYDWAERIWDWTTATGLIDESYRIYDGASTTDNCQEVQQLQWTYNPGIFIYGTAMLYNYTNGSSIWETRLTGLIEQVDQTFFQAEDNATNVMVEAACEPYGTCNNDQFSFKAYLARFLAKAMVVAPYTRTAILPLLTTSAQGAAKSCSGPSDGVTCGQKWYTEFDGNYGIGQELSALEVTQALLIDEAPELMDHNDVKIKPATTSSTLKPTVSIGPASVSGITSTSATATGAATSATTAAPSSTSTAGSVQSVVPHMNVLLGGALIGAAALL